MANYFNIPNSMLDPDAPLISELAYAWRDNPIAIAEGASGAPRVFGRATRPEVKVQGPTTGAMNCLGLAGYTGVYGEVSTFNSTMRMRFSNDNGASWFADVAIAETHARNYKCQVWVNFSNGSVKALQTKQDTEATPYTYYLFETTVSGLTSACNAVSFNSNSNQKAGFFIPNGGVSFLT